MEFKVGDIVEYCGDSYDWQGFTMEITFNDPSTRIVIGTGLTATSDDAMEYVGRETRLNKDNLRLYVTGSTPVIRKIKLLWNNSNYVKKFPEARYV